MSRHWRDINGSLAKDRDKVRGEGAGRYRCVADGMTMLTTILLVLDGQSADHGSVNLGLRWASEFSAMLVGLGVIDERATHLHEPVPIGAGEAKRQLDAARLHEQQVLIGNMLSAIAIRCAHGGVAFKPLEFVGSPAEEIAVEAQRFDLIIMPRFLNAPDRHGHLGLSGALQTLLRSAPRPIVAAPEHAVTGESIVVAYDGSLQAARTLHALIATGLAIKHPVHVISVDAHPLEAARRGNRAIEFLAAHDIVATLSAKPSDEPAKQIMDLAAEVEAGLIVMGAYGKSRIREFFLGSVTCTVLAECRLPLFLYH
jgi:nucleotide-binding universal stress UspA family protein